MRRTWTMITGLAAGLALTAGALVAAPTASANGVPATPTITGAVVLPQAAGTAATGGKVSLTWTGDALPADDTWLITATPVSGTPLTQNFTGTGASPVTQTVTGLTLGISYTFTVTGRNASGSSPASAASSAVIPYATPTPPLSVSALAGNAQVSVSWAAPAHTGGLPITSYTATATATGAAAIPSDTCLPSPLTGTSCTIGPLTNGAQYAVTVTATNAGTAGSATSAASTAVLVTPTANSGLPSAPTGPVVATQISSGGKTIEVSFTPNSTSPAGFDLLDYRASCTSGATTLTGTNSTSPIAITSASPVSGSTYTCRVQAQNSNGFSGNSATSNSVTMNATGVFGAPAIGAASGGAGEATVRWSAPAAVSGLTITGYQVQYTTTGVWSVPVTVVGTGTSTVLPLPAGSYQFQVRALNTGGAGAWSSASNPAVTVTAGTLNAPTAVTATPGVAKVDLAWTAPTGGTLSPTSYRVRYSSNNGGAWTTLDPTGSTSTTATVENLTNGTAYVFAVQSINGDVASGWSTNSAAVSPGTPGKPTGLAGKAGNAQVELTWTAPATATGVPAPTGYQVQYQVKGTTTWLPSTPLAATASPRIVTGLTNGTTYTFRVRAVNGPNVTGDWSDVSAEVTPVSPVVATIVIEGSRGTGNDANRIHVDGVTTGLVGQKVTPYFRFPGQSGFTAGTGTRTVDADGLFTWSRKTGKRIVVQFRAGDIRSERIIIEAK